VARHHTEEATGESVTLVYRSVVRDDWLSESEVELRQKWEPETQ
jgi:hypothetical protein